MLRPIGFLLGATLAVATQAQEATLWAAVSASRESRQIEVVSFPPPPTEEVVKLVGRRDVTTAPPSEPRHVFSVDIHQSPDEPDVVRTPNAYGAAVIPSGALWPGIDGRIKEIVPEAGAEHPGQVSRNPWEVRIRPKVAKPDSIFVCGGIIAGGDGASVAFVNGRIERRGDLLDGFVVDAVAASAVVLSRNGVKFVLPLGRRTAVANEEP